MHVSGSGGKSLERIRFKLRVDLSRMTIRQNLKNSNRKASSVKSPRRRYTPPRLLSVEKKKRHLDVPVAIVDLDLAADVFRG
jgi:hypothetical protein